MKREFVEPEVIVVQLLMEVVASGELPDASMGTDIGAPEEWD